MSGKALALRVTDIQVVDVDGVENSRISFDVLYISAQNQFKQLENIDVFFVPGDSVATIKTKVRDTIIAKALDFGMTVTTTNVGSIMQI